MRDINVYVYKTYKCDASALPALVSWAHRLLMLRPSAKHGSSLRGCYRYGKDSTSLHGASRSSLYVRC